MGISKKHLRRSKKTNLFLCERLEPRILLDGDCGDDSGDDPGDSSGDPSWGLFDTGDPSDSSGSSDYSPPDDTSGDTSAPTVCPPTAPSHLTLQSPSSSKIFLSWQNNSDDQDFIRVKRLSGNGTYTTVATLNGDATSFTDSGLQAGTAYSYAVVALNSAGRSDFSNVATFTLANPTDPTLIGQFGHLPGGRASVPFSFVDTDGTQIHFKLTGPGVAAIHLAEGGTSYNLTLTGTTLTSAVHITTTQSRATGDDGRFDLASLTVGDPSNLADHTAIGTFSAKTTDLDGDLTITGPASNLTLGNITGGDLTIGNAAIPSTPALNLTLGQVTNTSINSSIGIHTLSAIRWTDTTSLITAPSLQILTITGQKAHGATPAVTGDFQASLNLTGTTKGKVLSAASIQGTLSDDTWNLTGKAGTITAASATDFALKVNDSSASTGDLAALTLTSTAATSTLQLSANSLRTLTIRGNLTNSQLSLRQNVNRKQPALGTLLVKGALSASQLRTAGNINSLTIGVLDHTLLFAGLQDTLTSLPTTGSDFTSTDPKNLATLSNLTLTGLSATPAGPVLINSDIAAGIIRHVKMPRALSAIQDLDQTTPFGFATLLAPVTHYTGPASAGNYISGANATIL